MALPKQEWNLGTKYEIVKKIGRGSFGTVYLVTERDTGAHYAAKMISGIFDDALDAKRLLREISILKNMEHPNIVNIHDVIIPQGDTQLFNTAILIMEAVQSDLKTLFRAPAFLDDDQIVYIFYQIVCGLKYMHSANILHRDLKPANVLINSDCSIKIADLGLARSYARLNKEYQQVLDTISEEPKESEAVSRPMQLGQTNAKQLKENDRLLTGHVVTRWYRAPEIILLEKEYNMAVDIWSLGCLFAELLNMKEGNSSCAMDRQPIFPGKSCFPLSPDVRTKNRQAGFPITEYDQIKMIFDIIGTPNEDDINFITDPKALYYVQSFPHKDPVDLQTLYPASDSVALDLLRRLLTFNPNERITLEEVINHPFLERVRDLGLEVDAENPQSFEWDNDPNLTIQQIRDHFINLVRSF